jgi:2-polyprenyl-3-methyl-5-hydroxy-6-metoxy-1,4-benzoquinol methylase
VGISIIDKQTNIKNICDLGCGNGYLAILLAERGYNVTGIDASQSGIKVAKKYCKTKNNIKFTCADIRNISIDKIDTKFDLVVSIDVLEHLYRPADLIDASIKLLKTDGHILLATPYHGYIKNLFICLLNRWDSHHAVHWDGGHIKFFSVKTMQELLSKYELKNIKFYFHGRAPLLWKNMFCLARKN